MSQTQMTVDQLRAATAAQTKRGEKSARLRAKFAATPPLPTQTPEEKQRQRALFERHDQIEIRIRLPLPPSANGLKVIRALPGSKTFLAPSLEYNLFKEAVAIAWKAHWNGWPPEPLTGRLRVRAIVHQAQNGGDVANREKALCDALTEVGAWANDDLIDDIHLIRGSVIKGTGAIDVEIETIPE